MPWLQNRHCVVQYCITWQSQHNLDPKCKTLEPHTSEHLTREQVCGAIRDVNKARDRGSDIIEGVDLDCSLGFTKLGPPENTKTKVDHR